MGCGSMPTTPLPPSMPCTVFSAKKRTSVSPSFSAIFQFTPPRALSMLVCIDTTHTPSRMAFHTVRCTSVTSLTCFSPRNSSGWWLTTRLQPRRTASSTTRSVTSRHNNAPETSASVSPICRPALSQLSCSGRGANCSRALSTCFIFTLLRCFETTKLRLSAELRLIEQSF